MFIDIAKKISAHIFMWTFIGIGMILAFVFIPAQMVFGKNYNNYYLIIPLGVYLVYHLISAFYERFRLFSAGEKTQKAIILGVYGKSAHPTCTTLAIISWIVFFYLPDARILVSSVWISAVVFLWIKVEETYFLTNGHPKLPKQTSEAA